MFPWLDYKQDDDTVFCFACKKFLTQSDSRGRGVFVDQGFGNWKKGLEKFKKHAESGHVNAMAKCLQWKSMRAQNTSVAQQLSSLHKAEVEGNRSYLKAIIHTLAFCARQNIAIRGHVEDRSDVAETSMNNRGNFLELLSLRCSDNPALKNRLARKDHGPAWLSPLTQNELLKLVGDRCIERICQEAQTAEYFGVIVDETADISRKEQVSISIRYCVDGCMMERFIGFYDTPSQTGQQLYELLTDTLTSLGFKLPNLVGEGYDGASNMSGKTLGLAAKMKAVAPKSLYVHCHAHRLNLALQQSISSNTELRNCLGVIQSLYNFIEGSCKRHEVFSKIQREAGQKAKVLKGQCDTRWSCRYAAVKSTMDNLTESVQALLEIEDDPTPKVTADARGLIRAVCSHDFVLCLTVLEVVFGQVDAFSKYLQ